MLTSVELTNYRGFKTYKMDGLAQVNLFVGKNNSGKTALAEAINFITASGNPLVLLETAQRRGELIAIGDGGRTTSDLTHFFHGHVLSADSSFTLRSDNGYPTLTVRLVPIQDDPALFSDEDEVLEAQPAFGVAIDGAAGFGSESKDVRLSERGGLIINARARMSQPPVGSVPPIPPTIFVPTDSLTPRRLPLLWRQVVLDSNEDDVVTAMKLVENSIKQIVYLPLDTSVRNVGTPRDWYVQTSGDARPVPLGSFGDGMRRLMVLALSLARVENGTLLVDEIDTGLHYSIMSDLWKLVIRKAALSNVQVFATTHSWDCIEGLSLLCQREPDLMSRVAIHKIDRAIPHSIGFSGESIVRMTKSDIDPR